MPNKSFGGSAAFFQNIEAKTADYAVLVTDNNTLFTTRGAGGAVTFTLPAVTDLPKGFDVTFYNVSASGLVVASNGSSDNIVALNDAGADTLTATTTSLMIGVSIRVVWDGTGWLSFRGAGGTIAVA